MRPTVLLLLQLPLCATLPCQRSLVATPARVPVHVAQDGRHWAAGADYKVSFDAGGMAFYPVLGEQAPRNLPFVWRTRTIAYGSGPTLVAKPPAQAPEVRAASDRFEIDHGSVVERYLVRDDGVEQQWLLRAKPAELGSCGDLVVVGSVEGPLHIADRDAAHAPVELRSPDDGREVVRYGTATAVDADGAKCALTTAVTGRELRITVPEDWLRGARWPVLIDPLTSRAGALLGVGPASLPSVARDEANRRIAVAAARASAAGDWDLFVHLLDDSLNSPVLIHSDLTLDSVQRASVGWAAVAHRFVVAMEVRDAAQWRLRVYFHDTASTSFDSGLTVPVPQMASIHLSHPELGTSRSSRTAYLVAQRDLDPAGPSNTNRSEAVGFIVDTLNRSVGSATALSFVSGETYDAERPRIVPFSDLGGFAVAWQEWDPLSSSVWDVVGRRIATTGVIVGQRATLLSGSDHELTPALAGGNGRFLLAAVRRPRGAGSKTISTRGQHLLTRRFEWSEAAVLPTLHSVVQLDQSPTADGVALGAGSRGIAYDILTASHWSVAWQREDLDSLRIARIGYDGFLVEQQDLEPPPPLGHAYRSPTLWPDIDARGVVAVYASQGVAAGDPLFARRFTHDTSARSTTYGTGCAGVPRARNRTLSRSLWRGSEFCSIELEFGRTNAPVWLLAGLWSGQSPLPLAPAGCQLLLDQALMIGVVASGVTDATGYFGVPLAVPSAVTPAPLYWQFLQLDGGLLYGSNGLRTDLQ